MVSITAAPNTFATANQDSYVQGVEFDGELLLDRGWSLYGNFWYTYGKNLVTAAPLSRIPPAQVLAGARWHDVRTRAYVDLFAWMVSRQDRLNFQDVSDSRIPPGGTPGYATFNIRCGQQLTPHQRVSLNLENIFDKHYRVHGSGVDGQGKDSGVSDGADGPGFSAIFTYEVNR